MQKPAITTESCSPEDMSYYVMIRETIHGLDNLIVTTIHHSVTIITGALVLGVVLAPIIADPWGRVFLGIITVVALILTWGSHRRVKLYSDMLTQQVAVAEDMEDLLLSDDSIKAIKPIEEKDRYTGIKITKRIEKNVEYAGMKGEIIFKIGIMAFYVIEFALLVYLVLTPFFGWEV